MVCFYGYDKRIRPELLALVEVGGGTVRKPFDEHQRHQVLARCVQKKWSKSSQMIGPKPFFFFLLEPPHHHCT